MRYRGKVADARLVPEIASAQRVVSKPQVGAA